MLLMIFIAIIFEICPKVNLFWIPSIELFKIFSHASARHPSSFAKKHDLCCLLDASSPPPSSLTTIYPTQFG
ncbi:hypothetical protein AAZX31_10G154900 [Glycine max]